MNRHLLAAPKRGDVTVFTRYTWSPRLHPRVPPVDIQWVDLRGTRASCFRALLGDDVAEGVAAADLVVGGRLTIDVLVELVQTHF